MAWFQSKANALRPLSGPPAHHGMLMHETSRHRIYFNPSRGFGTCEALPQMDEVTYLIQPPCYIQELPQPAPYVPLFRMGQPVSFVCEGDPAYPDGVEEVELDDMDDLVSKGASTADDTTNDRSCGGDTDSEDDKAGFDSPFSDDDDDDDDDEEPSQNPMEDEPHVQLVEESVELLEDFF